MSHNLKNTTENIDLVYLWVNGNDPQWIARRNACIGEPTGQQENCSGRYADSGELRYSLRSIERYAPWIHKIYIVTDSQVPEWLDTTHPKVQIVDHTDIMPPESLPCFNSAVIEQFLYKIPGLSEHFLYANDDMLLGQPVSPDTFFTPDGKPILYMNRRPFRKLVLYYREKVLGKQLSPYLLTIRNAAKLVEKRYGKYYGCKAHHNIDAYTRSIFQTTHEVFGTELCTMWSHHMRSPQDIQRSIFAYVALAEGMAHLQYVTQRHSLRLHIHSHRNYKKFEHYHPVFFCVNDSEYATDDDRKCSIEFLQRLFPEKSSMEK